MKIRPAQGFWICLLMIGFAACGGGEMTLAEYTGEVATVLQRVDARLAAHATELSSGSPDMDATRAYLADRVAGYEEMVKTIGGLDPPEPALELHLAFVGLLDDLLAAERARAEFAATLASSEDPDLIWDSPYSAVVDAAEAEAVEICYAAQERVVETQERGELSDLPWIPPEMKEVVRTAFRCP